MVFYDKIKWVMGILMIFVLIIATNLIDRNNFEQVRDTATTIYEDRLVAKDLIYKMADITHQLEIAVLSKDSTAYAQNKTRSISELNSLASRFQKTKLTKEESKIFTELNSEITSLASMERSYPKNTDNQMLLKNHLIDIDAHLKSLSQIQMSEGRRQMNLSKKAVDMVDLFTQLEIYVLVFLAIAIQIIILYDPKAKKQEKV
ncbi:MAG: MCP four helix bundle domain-containing protein [Nonlabens sp.]